MPFFTAMTQRAITCLKGAKEFACFAKLCAFAVKCVEYSSGIYGNNTPVQSKQFSRGMYALYLLLMALMNSFVSMA